MLKSEKVQSYKNEGFDESEIELIKQMSLNE